MIAIFTIFGFGRWLQFADIAIERLIFDHNSLIFQLRDLISRYSASIFDCNSEILVLSCSTCCCGSYFQSSILRFRWSIQWSFIWWLRFLCLWLQQWIEVQQSCNWVIQLLNYNHWSCHWGFRSLYPWLHLLIATSWSCLLELRFLCSLFQ